MRPPGSLLPEIYSVRFHQWLARALVLTAYVLLLSALFALLGDITQTPPATEPPATAQFPSTRDRILDAARAALRDRDIDPGALTERAILEDAQELHGLLAPEDRAALKERAEDVAEQILDRDRVAPLDTP